jgi:hypothetical protein
LSCSTCPMTLSCYTKVGTGVQCIYCKRWFFEWYEHDGSVIHRVPLSAPCDKTYISPAAPKDIEWGFICSDATCRLQAQFNMDQKKRERILRGEW